MSHLEIQIGSTNLKTEPLSEQSSSEDEFGFPKKKKRIKQLFSDAELIQRSHDVRLKAMKKLEEFWNSTGEAVRRPEESDVKTSIFKGNIKLQLRCLICKQYKIISLWNNTSISMANYSKHASHHFSMSTEDSKTEMKLDPTKLSPVKQPKSHIPEEEIVDNCMTCGKLASKLTPITSRSFYTKKPFHKLIGLVTKAPIIDITSSICHECKRRFNKYDSLRKELMDTKASLGAMVLKTIQSTCTIVNLKIEAIDIKNEPDTEEDEDLSFANGAVASETLDVWKVDESQYFEHEDHLIEEDVQTDLLFETAVINVPKPAYKMVGRKPVKKVKVYKCPICALECPSATALHRHKVKHPSERKHICEICTKAFGARENLRSHLRTHGIGPKFSCDYCGNEFAAKNGIRRHMEASHTTEFRYLCYLCPKAYTAQVSLRKHIASHINEKDFSCHICSAKFLFKYRLDRHLNTHTEKSNPCPHCNMMFNEKYQVTAHIQRIHSGQRIKEELKFDCTVCDRKFARKHLLRKHLEKAHEVASEEEQEALSAEFTQNKYW